MTMADVRIDKDIEPTIDPTARLSNLERLIGTSRIEEVVTASRTLVSLMAAGPIRRRHIRHFNSSDTIGGVGEVLRSLVPMEDYLLTEADLYLRTELNPAVRRHVIRGNPQFWGGTMWLHKAIHDTTEDPDFDLDAYRTESYVPVSRANAARLAQQIVAGDLGLFHDPQVVETMLLCMNRVPNLLAAWRSHIGYPSVTPLTERAFEFLRPGISQVPTIWTMKDYIPPFLREHNPHGHWLMRPPVNPDSPKLREIVNPWAVLVQLGLAQPRQPSDYSVELHWANGLPLNAGSPGDLMVLQAAPIPPHATLYVGVARWDFIKDPEGVMRGFANGIAPYEPDAHALLLGPSAANAEDDPGSAAVWQTCCKLWWDLPPEIRAQIHLVAGDNSVMINAAQHEARVIWVKSLVEGYGLTVAEGQWHGRQGGPVVLGSAVGGITMQIDGTNGVLLRDPRDLVEFARLSRQIAENPAYANRLSVAGRRSVIDHGLVDQLILDEFRFWTEQLLAQRAN